MSPETQQNAEAYINTRLTWIQDAVELLSGDRDADPAMVLEAPMQNPQDARAASPIPKLTAEQEQSLREIAGRFGIGGEADVTSVAKHQILEGGKPWKVEAEAAISESAQTILFSGSSYRKIGADESDYMRIRYGVELAGDTEYDMVRKIAEKQRGFVLADEEEVLPFGYAVSEAHEFLHEPTEQLVKIGELIETDEHGDATARKSVLLLRVDGETYVDEDKKEKQRFRPDSAAQMGFVAQVLSACGDETSSVALNTSTTYAARVIDTLRAGLMFERVFDVGMYGRQTLADVKDEPVAKPTELQNIPGELRIAYDKIRQLIAAVSEGE